MTGHVQTVSVRYDGPEAGLTLLEHALREGGLRIVKVERASDDPTPAPMIVNLVYHVAGNDQPEFLIHVRAVIAHFAQRYNQAGLDVDS